MFVYDPLHEKVFINRIKAQTRIRAGKYVRLIRLHTLPLLWQKRDAYV